MTKTAIEDFALSSNKRLILGAQVAFLPTGVLTTLLGPMLPLLIVRWNLNDVQAGTLFPVQFLSSLLGVQISGVLLTQFGYRLAFLSGLLFMACGAATLYLGSAFLGMASVAIYGMGIGLLVPADSLLIAEVVLHSRASAVSLLNFYWGLGAVVCSLMVAWSAAHRLLPVFLGSVSLLLVVLALVMRGLHFPAAVTEAGIGVRWAELARNPLIWLFATVFFLYPGAETAVGGWIGSYVVRLGPQEARWATIMPAFFWATLTLGRALGSIFLSSVPERDVLRVGFATGAVGIGLILLARALLGVILGALVTGLSFATLYPITIARFSQRFGLAARSTGAIMFSLASVGPAIIPWMVGIFSQATASLRAGLLLPLAATVILFLIHLHEW